MTDHRTEHLVCARRLRDGRRCEGCHRTHINIVSGYDR